MNQFLEHGYSMDPEVALRCADESLDACDLNLAAEYLEAYRFWRKKGGWEPPSGDSRCATIAIRAAAMGFAINGPREEQSNGG